MTPDHSRPEIDKHTIELIAERVAEMLRTELEGIAAALAATDGSQRPLTVGQVADRFGVARSTVYTHWREWGGYKLGVGDKAAIRFAPQALPERLPGVAAAVGRESGGSGPPKRQRRRRDLLRGKPRFESELAVDAIPRDFPDRAVSHDAPTAGGG